MPSRSIFTPGSKGGRTRGSKSATRWVLKSKQPVFRPLQLRARRLVYPPKTGDKNLVIHRRGPLRMLVGFEDPQEKRAMSEARVAGTLPERIFYKSLVDRGMREGVDFSFQSSLQGGRLFLGGMVADFILQTRALVVRIQGRKWHTGFAPERRDDFQRDVLENMGYHVLDVFDDTIYDQWLFDEWLRRHIDVHPSTGGFFYDPEMGADGDLTMSVAQELRDMIQGLQTQQLEDKARIEELEGLISPTRVHPHLQITDANITNVSVDTLTSGDLSVGKHIQSSGFTTGSTGFKIEGSGDAEFGNLTARGELKTFGVLEGTQSAYGGNLIVSSGVGKLIADVASGDESIDVSNNDLRALDNVQFQPTAARVEWMRIRSAPLTIPGGYRYPVDRAISGTAQAFKAGEIGVAKGRAVDTAQRSSNWAEYREGATALWGTLGIGWGVFGKVGYFADTFPTITNEVTTDQGYSNSFFGIEQRTGTSVSNFTDYARLGTLDGFLSYGSTPSPTAGISGFAVGESNNYLIWDKDNGLQTKNKTAGIHTDQTGFISQDQSSGSSDHMRWQNTSGTQKAHMYLHSDDSMYMIPTPGEAFVVGTLASSTYKNWIRIEPADATFENANSIVMYDDDGGSYAMSEAMGAIWAGADSGGTYQPEDLHIGAADDIIFYTDVDGTPTIVAGITESGLFTHSISALTDGVTAPGTASGWAQIYVDSADGDLKVKFGDGTVKTIATDT